MPTRTWALALGVLFLLLIAGVSHGKAQGEDSAAVTLRRLHEAYLARRNQLDPAWIRFELTKFESEGYLRLSRRGNPTEAKWTVEAEYARKGSRYRTYAKSDDKRLSPGETELFGIYTGEIRIRSSNNPDVFFVSKKPIEHWASATPSTVAGEHNLFDHLEKWVKQDGKKPKVTTSQERVGGVDQLYVETVSANNWKLRCWIFPERNYALQRYEVYSGAQPVSKHETTEFVEANGLWLPKKCRQEHFLAGGQSIAWWTDCIVAEVETQARKVPDRLFKFDLPTGAAFWDEDEQVFVRRTELTESHLKEVVKRAALSGSGWSPWLVAVAVASFVAGCVGFVWYRRRRSGNLLSKPN